MKVDYAKLYTEYHRLRWKCFSGLSVVNYAGDIATLVESVKAKRILDYGCGKGFQYLANRIHDQWGGILPYCYDIGVPKISKIPLGKFDGVICTDVLEHIHQEDLDEILQDIFSRVNRRGFVFLAIGTSSAKKKFQDGTNIHLTIKPPDWWEKKLKPYDIDGLELLVRYEHKG